MTVTTPNDARVLDTLRDVVDHVTVGKVFGTPLTQGELIVLPVAKIVAVTALLVVRALITARAAGTRDGARTRSLTRRAARFVSRAAHRH